MCNLMAFIARTLVREPDQVSVVELDDERDRIFQLRVAPADRGRVIGKEGRTARALRTLLAVGTGRTGRKAKLDIVD